VERFAVTVTPAKEPPSYVQSGQPALVLFPLSCGPNCLYCAQPSF
jgi:hypothetical protein